MLVLTRWLRCERTNCGAASSLASTEIDLSQKNSSILPLSDFSEIQE